MRARPIARSTNIHGGAGHGGHPAIVVRLRLGSDLRQVGLPGRHAVAARPKRSTTLALQAAHGAPSLDGVAKSMLKLACCRGAADVIPRVAAVSFTRSGA